MGAIHTAPKRPFPHVICIRCNKLVNPHLDSLCELKNEVINKTGGIILNHRPMMTTADPSLRFDQVYEPIARRLNQNPEKFADAYARFQREDETAGPLPCQFRPE